MAAEEWIRLILGSNVIAAVIVGMFGLVTLKLGIRKFASEKWWERRAEAYAAVISGLHTMLELHTHYEDALRKGYELSEDYALALDQASVAGSDELKKGANIGPFIMSKRAGAILRSTLDELEKISPFTSDMLGYHEEKSSVISAAILNMTVEAKRDLKT